MVLPRYSSKASPGRHDMRLHLCTLACCEVNAELREIISHALRSERVLFFCAMAANGVKATVRFVTEDLFLSITPSGHALPIDTDSKRSSAASPVELLLVALGSCTATDVASILAKKRQQVTSYLVEVSGTRRDEHPRSFASMKVHHIVTGKSISAKAVAHAIELSETKYCSVAATLRPGVEIQTTFEIIEDSPDVTQE
jgi:putative redox protein